MNQVIVDNLRQLRDQLRAQAETIEETRKLLDEISPLQEKVTLDAAVNAAAVAWNVRPDMILTRTREGSFSEARMAIAHYYRKAGNPLESIATLLGRDHTAIIHATNRVADLLEVDSRFRAQYAQFIDLAPIAPLCAPKRVTSPTTTETTKS